jgi:hypothetical protein
MYELGDEPCIILRFIVILLAFVTSFLWSAICIQQKKYCSNMSFTSSPLAVYSA